MSDLKDRMPTPGKAVARTDQPVSPATMIQRAIEAQAVGFQQVMPAGVDPERFGRLVLTAVKATPQLMECFGTDQGKTSVLLAAMQCAALGLEPNTATQDAWLLPRRNNNVMEAELSIGYRGLLKLARRSGIVKSIRAEVVYEADEFHYEYGLDADTLRHVPADVDDPGPLVKAYAVARFSNGGSQFVVLSRRAVEKRRAMSPSWSNTRARPYSPWTKWEDEMWRKTAVRALIPYLELRTEDAQGLERDEQPLRINDGVIDVAEVAGELGAGPSGGDVAVVSGDGQETVDPGSTEGPATPPDAPPARERPRPKPDPEDEPDPAVPVSTHAEPMEMSQGQSRALHALLKKKMGVSGDERHPVLSGLLERPIASASELSWSDASTVIDLLNNMEDHEPAK